MTTRTSNRTVTFGRPFTLKGVDEMLPAGVYTVEIDEEPLTGISFLAYRRISALFHLPGRPDSAVVAQVLAIDPNELDAALERDRRHAGTPVGEEASKKKSAAKRRQASSDRQAIERGENEGMMIPIQPKTTCPRR